MSKIKQITVKNFKAISEFEMNLDGATAVIVAGNNRGKTSLIRGLPDRLRGEKPQMIVKEGEKEGFMSLTLTTGEKFEWQFNVDGKDKLIFHTKDQITTSVTKAITAKYFKESFDIDSFLTAAPKKQSEMLQKLVGVDFTTIDLEYKLAYDERTLANRTFENEKVKLQSLGTPEKTEEVDTKDLIRRKSEVRFALNEKYLGNVAANKKLREEWQKECDQVKVNVDTFNGLQGKRKEMYDESMGAYITLSNLGYTGLEVKEFVAALKNKIEPQKEYKPLPEPTYISELPDDAELKAIDEKINNATEINSKAAAYNSFLSQKEAVKDTEEKALTADGKVKEIEARRNEMITKAKFPAGITIDDEGIKVDGFALDKNQISTSKLYCTALRLASLNLGEVKALYFDASPLDKITLREIEAWSQENGLQLLIERVAEDGSNIKYEIIEHLS